MRVLAARAPARHLISRGANSEALQFRKALMLVSFSDAYESLGQTDEALHRSIEARTLLRKISAANSGQIDTEAFLGRKFRRDLPNPGRRSTGRAAGCQYGSHQVADRPLDQPMYPGGHDDDAA